jgi:thiol:disulfide interchange protein DsbD
VQRDFKRRNVAYLLGDWTRQDPVITRFLRDHDRDGVPLYLLYAPGATEPKVLPQILTEAQVLNALDALGG